MFVAICYDSNRKLKQTVRYADRQASMIHFKPQKTSLKKFKVRATELCLKRPNNGKESNCMFNMGILKSEVIWLLLRSRNQKEIAQEHEGP